MTENVIAIRSRKPLTETVEAEKKSAAELEDLNHKAHLQTVDNFRRLVEDRKLEGLIVIGRSPETGLFYYDVIFPTREGEGGCTPQEAISYTGFLDIVRTQFSDIASWAPCIMPDGSIYEPEPFDEEGDE